MRPGPRHRQTVTAALTSEQGVLGVLTANDLLWRTLADLPVVVVRRSLETLQEGIVVPALVSLLTGVESELQGIALLAQWLFIAALFYLLAPKVFRETAKAITEDAGFRLVTTVAALGFALVVSTMLLESPWPLGRAPFFAGFLGAVCLALGGYGWYFRAVRGWSTRPVEGRIDLLSRFLPVPARDRAELRASSRATDVWSRVRVRSILLALAFVCTVSAFFLGLLAVLLLGLYPVGELLVLASVGLNAVADRYGLPFGLEPPHHYALDVEARLKQTVSNVETSIKGWTTLFLVLLCGLAFQVIAFVAVFPLVWTGTIPFLRTALDGGITSTFSLVLVWNSVGMGLGLLAAVCFGLWYWLRMLERVPAFLERWEPWMGLPAFLARRLSRVDRPEPTEADSKPDHEREVTRPVGLMGPPTLVFLITVLWIAFTPERGALALTPVDVGYAFAWPLSLVLLVVAVGRTGRTQPQPPETDAVAIPLALLVQFGGELSFLWIENLGTGGPPTLVFPSFVVFLFLLVPWLFFLEDVYRWARDREDVSEYLYVAYLGVFGVLVMAIGVLGPGRSNRVFLVFGAVVVVLAGVLALDEYHSTGRT